MIGKKCLEYIREHWFFIGVLALVLFKNSILAEQPFVARGNFPHDDTLFMVNSLKILNGQWLGTFDQMTLLRGPLYPLWLCLVYIIGVPLIHANDLFYLCACLVVVKALSLKVESRTLLFLSFVFLYFSPHSYDYASISHSFRMTIYATLALFVFGAALGLSIRLTDAGENRLGWSLLFGLAFSFFWYVREEGVWVLPALLFFFSCILLGVFLNAGLGRTARAFCFLVIVPGLFFAGTTAILKYLNETHYGSPVILEIKTPEFKRAYNAMLRVEAPKKRRYVHVTRETLKELYRVSPKMAELKPYLDHSARYLPFKKQLPAATFFFSFRDAVASAGYYEKGLPEVLKFYDALGTEIEEACESGQLTCGKLVYSLVPLWQPEFTSDLPESFFRQLSLIVRFPDFNPRIFDYRSDIIDLGFYNAGRLTHSAIRVQDEAQTAAFPHYVRDAKLNIFDDIGDLHNIVRPILFCLCLLMLVYLLFLDLRTRRINPLSLFAVSVFIAISGLAAIVAVIDVTSFHRLFRQRHGALALVSLFVVVILLEAYRRKRSKKDDPAHPLEG